MDYDRIIIEMLSRIQALEDKVAALEMSSSDDLINKLNASAVSTPSSKKYRLLSDYLLSCKSDTVRLTYEDIENILLFKLPSSADAHRAFWANTKTHSIALSWMSVGFETVEVNLQERYIVFERKRDYVDIGRRKAADILTEIGHMKVSELQSNTPKGGGTRGK